MYSPMSVDFKLTPEARERLNSLWELLLAQGAKLLSGRPVKSASDAALWAIEQLPISFEEEQTLENACADLTSAVRACHLELAEGEAAAREPARG